MKLSHGPALILCAIWLRLQQEPLRQCYWDVICDKPSTVNIGWWLQPHLPSSFQKNIPQLQYCTGGVTLLWRSNYSEQSKELKTGHLNELREKYTRKQENVFITFQVSNWKNRDQYSRTSFNGVKNNPPQDRQESLTAKQTGQLGLGSVQWDTSTGAIPPASRWSHQGRMLWGTQQNIPPKGSCGCSLLLFSPNFFIYCTSHFIWMIAEVVCSTGWWQHQESWAWEIGTQHDLTRAEVWPTPLSLAPSTVRRRKGMLLSHGFVLSMMLGMCRTPLPLLSHQYHSPLKAADSAEPHLHHFCIFPQDLVQHGLKTFGVRVQHLPQLTSPSWMTVSVLGSFSSSLERWQLPSPACIQDTDICHMRILLLLLSLSLPLPGPVAY